MNKFYLGATTLVSLAVLAASSSVAIAKGGEDNPAVVIIDQSGSSNNVDANITNDSSNPVPVDGTVAVSNFPQSNLIPFARECSNTDEDCSVNLTDLAEMGEVHITQVSGQALNVGKTASPRFFVASGVELYLPTTVNSTDTGNDRDILFSQSMDLIPVNSNISFVEVDSTEVFFKVAGYVAGSSAADAAAATGTEVSFTESTEEP